MGIQRRPCRGGEHEPPCRRRGLDPAPQKHLDDERGGSDTPGPVGCLGHLLPPQSPTDCLAARQPDDGPGDRHRRRIGSKVDVLPPQRKDHHSAMTSPMRAPFQACTSRTSARNRDRCRPPAAFPPARRASGEPSSSQSATSRRRACHSSIVRLGEDLPRPGQRDHGQAGTPDPETTQGLQIAKP